MDQGIEGISRHYLSELDLPLTGTNYFLTPVSENKHRTMTPALGKVRSFELGTKLGVYRSGPGPGSKLGVFFITRDYLFP